MAGWWLGGGSPATGAVVLGGGSAVAEGESRGKAKRAFEGVPGWLSDEFRAPPALFMCGIGRVNPIFVDDDIEGNETQSTRHAHVGQRPYESSAPESPGKSGSSGYESNPCSDEASRWETRVPAPKRAAASRAARRQAYSLRTNRRRPQSEQQREVECEQEEGHARAILAPIPEGKVGGLAPRAADAASFPASVLRPGSDALGDGGRKVEGRGGQEEEEEEVGSDSTGGSAATNALRRAPETGRRRRPRGPSSAGGREDADSCSPASTASSSPASSSSSGSGKRLLRRADAVKDSLWGEAVVTADEGAFRSSGGRRLGCCEAEDLDRSPGEISHPSPLSLSSSAASSVSSGFSVPPQRRKLIRPQEQEGLLQPHPGESEAANLVQPPAALPAPPRRQTLSEAEIAGVVVLDSAYPDAEAVDSRSWKGHTQGQRGSNPRRENDMEARASPYGSFRLPEVGGLCAADVLEKLRSLEFGVRTACVAPEGKDEGGGFGSSPWENYYEAGGKGGALPMARKTKESITVLQVSKSQSPSIASSGCFGGNEHLDFTLDMPRAERLMQQIAAAKRRRCWGRVAAATFALAFFLLSVVAVSMLYTRGKRVFGPL